MEQLSPCVWISLICTVTLVFAPFQTKRRLVSSIPRALKFHKKKVKIDCNPRTTQKKALLWHTAATVSQTVCVGSAAMCTETTGCDNTAGLTGPDPSETINWAQGRSGFKMGPHCSWPVANTLQIRDKLGITKLVEFVVVIILDYIYSKTNNTHRAHTHLFVSKHTHTTNVSTWGAACLFTGQFQWRELLIISPLHHERNPAAPLREPNGDVLGFPPPSPQIPAHPLWETPYRQGPHPTAPAPHLSYLHPHSPPNHGPKPRPHPTTLLCAWVVAQPGYCLAPAPRHVLYAQTDDTAALARQLRHKDNNVLPRSFINTPSRPSQPNSK